MNRVKPVSVVSGLFLAGLLVGVGSLTRSATSAAEIGSVRGIPARDRQTKLNDATLNSTQKAALTMRLLRDEVAQPTPNGVPGAADPRNHDTVAAHLVGELQGADLTTLRRAQSTAAGETRQLLSLALLQAGDPAGDADVRAVLRD